jgi:hypothetical protein
VGECLLSRQEAMAATLFLWVVGNACFTAPIKTAVNWKTGPYTKLYFRKVMLDLY